MAEAAGRNGMPDLVGWFYSLPPITRTWFGVSLAINAATTLEFLKHDDLLFHWESVQKKLELWRVATSFLYGGGSLTEFHVLIALHMIAMQSSTYESNPHPAGGTPRADYVFCLLVCIVLTIATFLLQDWYTRGYLYPLFTRTILTAITYLWARRNPRANVGFLFLNVQGQYLPFCHLLIALALQNPLYELLHGMLVGHVYYYLVQVVPTITGGKHILKCPQILVEIVNGIYGPQEDFRQPERPPQQPEPERTPEPQSTHNISETVRRRFQGEGATEAHIAAKMNHLERLRALSHSADGRQEFAAKDQNDWQPLHEAVRGGFTEIVEFLLSFPDIVDLNARTSGGKGPSPLWLAQDALGVDHPVTKRLIELGAEKIAPE